MVRRSPPAPTVRARPGAVTASPGSVGTDGTDRTILVRWYRLDPRQDRVHRTSIAQFESIQGTCAGARHPERMQLRRALQEGRRHPIAPRGDAAGKRAGAVAQLRDGRSIDAHQTAAEEIGVVRDRSHHEETLGEWQQPDAHASQLRGVAAIGHRGMAVVGECDHLRQGEHELRTRHLSGAGIERSKPRLRRAPCCSGIGAIDRQEIPAKRGEIFPLGNPVTLRGMSRLTAPGQEGRGEDSAEDERSHGGTSARRWPASRG